MPYVITGSATFSSQAMRDAAALRVTTATTGMALTPILTTIAAGLVNSGTTVHTVSVIVETIEEATATRNAIYNAWVGAGGTNRHVNGWLGVNKVE